MVAMAPLVMVVTAPKRMEATTLKTVAVKASNTMVTIKPKKTIKIGRPGYRVTKQLDPESSQRSLLFEVDYPEIEKGLQPRHRFMSAYEQRVEPPERDWQYLLMAAEPYETIGFKIPNKEIDKDPSKFQTTWDEDKKTFQLQLHFK